MSSPIVSLYENAYGTVGVSCSLDVIMSAIKGGRWKDRILALRSLEGKEYKEAKLTLPLFTGSGVFSKREASGLLEHSGRIVIDFDKVDNMSDTLHVLKCDPYSEYVFVSCGGKGIAVMVKISNDHNNHMRAFLTLQSYYARMYGLKVDSACKDVTRCRTVSFDEDLVYNEDSLMLTELDEIKDIAVDRGGLFSDGSRDNDLFTVANTMIKGGASRAVAIETLVRVIKGWGESKQDPEVWATEKVNNAIKRNDKSDVIRGRVNQIIDEVKDGSTFTVSSMYNDLGASNEVVKLSIRRAISNRLEDAKDIAHYGNKGGTYRKVSNKIEVMDIFSKQSEFYDMKWPLGIDNLARMLPRNIAVIAGAKSSGKSAMMMNIALLNSPNRKVRYMSSEMAVDEMRLRLEKFKDAHGNPLDMEVWRKVEFIYRTSDFADIIDPDGLNLIDFLEVHDEFWKVGGMIAEIHSKLKTGVAVIGIQKVRGKDVGRGADFTLEKARIYISLDRAKSGTGNTAKLIEVKTPVSGEESPRGLVCDYKLHGGCNFYTINSWHESSDESEV